MRKFKLIKNWRNLVDIEEIEESSELTDITFPINDLTDKELVALRDAIALYFFNKMEGQ